MTACGITRLACAIAFMATPSLAQMSHDHTGAHTASMPSGGGLSEPGQGAFAAISEVVKLLGENPETDWSAVNIGALRAHLVDMDMLVTYAEVEEQPVTDGLRMRVSLTGLAEGAARRMVVAHAPVLASETGWTSEVSQDGENLVWTVTSGESAQKIRALGFFGLMAVGDHHREHHLMMASGHGAH